MHRSMPFRPVHAGRAAVVGLRAVGLLHRGYERGALRPADGGRRPRPGRVLGDLGRARRRAAGHARRLRAAPLRPGRAGGRGPRLLAPRGRPPAADRLALLPVRRKPPARATARPAGQERDRLGQREVGEDRVVPGADVPHERVLAARVHVQLDVLQAGGVERGQDLRPARRRGRAGPASRRRPSAGPGCRRRGRATPRRRRRRARRRAARSGRSTPSPPPAGRTRPGTPGGRRCRSPPRTARRRPGAAPGSRAPRPGRSRTARSSSPAAAGQAGLLAGVVELQRDAGQLAVRVDLRHADQEAGRGEPPRASAASTPSAGRCRCRAGRRATGRPRPGRSAPTGSRRPAPARAPRPRAASRRPTLLSRIEGVPAGPRRPGADAAEDRDRACRLAGRDSFTRAEPTTNVQPHGCRSARRRRRGPPVPRARRRDPPGHPAPLRPGRAVGVPARDGVPDEFRGGAEARRGAGAGRVGQQAAPRPRAAGPHRARRRAPGAAGARPARDGLAGPGAPDVAPARAGSGPDRGRPRQDRADERRPRREGLRDPDPHPGRALRRPGRAGVAAVGRPAAAGALVGTADLAGDRAGARPDPAARSATS